MNVYVDESGDLGWTLDKPYHQGGSSRYLTIGCFLIPKKLTHLSERIVRKFYFRRHRPPTNELKGFDLKQAERVIFAKKVVLLLTQNPEIEVLCITVNKKNVESHIRADANKLYNYMVNLVLPERIKHKPSVTFIPDKRSIKVRSGNSLVDYLQVRLWFELKVITKLYNCPQESDQCLNLQFIDWICHIVWSGFEHGESKPFRILTSKIKSIPLFFK